MGLPGQAEELSVITQQPTSKLLDLNSPNSSALVEFARIDKLVVQQTSSAREDCFCGYEDENHFNVTDRFGNVILRAQEQSNICVRQCCEQKRGLVMELRDRDGKLVMLAKRPCRCDNLFCFPCCNQYMSVECPPGNYIGRAEQNVSFLAPSYDIVDSHDHTLYTIEGPSACGSLLRSCCCCCGRGCRRVCLGSNDADFVVRRSDNHDNVGKITRAHQMHERDRVLSNDMGSESDRFAIDFPDSADPQSKAVLLALCFLIDYLHFEQ